MSRRVSSKETKHNDNERDDVTNTIAESSVIYNSLFIYFLLLLIKYPFKCATIPNGKPPLHTVTLHLIFRFKFIIRMACCRCFEPDRFTSRSNDVKSANLDLTADRRNYELLLHNRKDEMLKRIRLVYSDKYINTRYYPSDFDTLTGRFLFP